MLAVGDWFTMKKDAEPFELRDPKRPALMIARYLPGHGYRVTGKNLDAANLLVSQGRAVAGQAAGG